MIMTSNGHEMFITVQTVNSLKVEWNQFSEIKKEITNNKSTFQMKKQPNWYPPNPWVAVGHITYIIHCFSYQYDTMQLITILLDKYYF